MTQKEINIENALVIFRQVQQRLLYGPDIVTDVSCNDAV